MTDNASEKRARTRQRRAWYTDLFRHLPRGVVPLEAVASVKCMDADGNVILVNVKTAGLATWEAFGMAAYAQDDFACTTLNAAIEDDD